MSDIGQLLGRYEEERECVVESIFLNILDMSLTAGCIIGVVLILRLFLKRLPKKYSYFLWSVVGFRLLCPVSFNSIFSIFNLKLFDRVNISGEDNDIAGKISHVRNVLGTVSQKAGSGMNVAGTNAVGMNGTGSVGTEITGTGLMTSGTMVSDSAAGGTVTAVDAVDKFGNVTASVSSGMSVDSMADITGNFGSMATGGGHWVKVLMIIWLVGMTIMLVYGIVSYIIMAGKLRNAVWKENNVYCSGMIDAPFVFGLVHPRIYLPDFLETGALEYVLLHENYHIRRLDYIVKPVAFVLLCIHWFNPLVWAAFYIMGRDMEMSCDEAVLARMVTEQKCVKNGKTELEVVKGYSYALLSCASQGSFNTFFQLGFGEMPVKERIKNVLKYKKYNPVVTAVLLIFCIFVLVACSTNSKKQENYPENTTNPEYILEVRDEVSFTQGRELDSSVKDSPDIGVTGILNDSDGNSVFIWDGMKVKLDRNVIPAGMYEYSYGVDIDGDGEAEKIFRCRYTKDNPYRYKTFILDKKDGKLLCVELPEWTLGTAKAYENFILEVKIGYEDMARRYDCGNPGKNEFLNEVRSSLTGTVWDEDGKLIATDENSDSKTVEMGFGQEMSGFSYSEGNKTPDGIFYNVDVWLNDESNVKFCAALTYKLENGELLLKNGSILDMLSSGKTAGRLDENFEWVRGEAPVYPMPVDNASLTAKYGYIKTVDGMNFNNYDNFAVDKGSNVYAVASGTVLKTGMEDDRGLGVVIQNRDGYTTEYYHLDSVIVNPDDIVVEGTVIGLAGESGNATGPMLSFGVSWDDTDTQIEWVEPVYTESQYIRLAVDYVLNDDGTYSCNGNTYKYELQVRGTEGESLITYIILTNDEETSFEDVSYSLKSSQIDTKSPKFVILGWY